MKVIIVDTFDHPSYGDIPRCMARDLPRLRSGAVRVYGEDFDSEILPALQRVRNAFIVFEDCRKYIRQNLQRGIENLIIDSKQKNLDLFFLYHTWGYIPPGIIQMVDFLEVFPTSDSPANKKNHIIGIYDDALKVYHQVKTAKKKWPHKSIDLRN